MEFTARPHLSPGGNSRLTLYSGWSDDLRAAELATLRHIDAAAWLGMAVSLLRSDEPTPVKIALMNNGEESITFLRQPSGGEVMMVRLLRYMSSEQLFALLLSAQDFRPYARFASRFRDDKLNKAYGDLGKGLVPEKFSLLGGDRLPFEAWLSVKLGDWNKGALCPSLIRFIRDEALFLSDRTFINAIKHGRARSGMDVSKVALDVDVDGVWRRILPPSDAIWVEEWAEDAGKFRHCVHVETFDYRAEIGTLEIARRLMMAMVHRRIAYLEFLASSDDSLRIDFSLPCDIGFSAAVSRMKGLPAMSGTTG